MDGVQLHLERKYLDIKCPRKIRVRIADEIIDEWYLVGRELDVSNKKLKSIRRDNSTPEEKAVDVLDAWADEHGSRATCLKLAQALHRRKKMRVIEILCDEVTQMKHETTMCLKPSDNQQQEQGHDIEPDVEVVTRIKELESQFRFLHRNIKSELESKKVTVRDLLDSLTFLPLELQQEYKNTITDMLPDLRREEEVSDLFLHLNPLVSFMDYGLTKYIIDEFGSNTLKKMINEYSKDVEKFMKKTTVQKMMDHWPGQQEIHPNYTRLMVTINEDPKTYTLYEVDKLRKRYCSELGMAALFFKTIGLKMSNSFIVEWLVPSVLVPQLIESAKQLDFAFYLRERMLKVVVGEKQIFPFLPDSKPKVPDSKLKVPALHTTAAMVTLSNPKPHSLAKWSKPSTVVKGKRKIWGTRKATSVADIITTITTSTSIKKGLTVERICKYKTRVKHGKPRRRAISKWWFIISGKEDTLNQLQEEWPAVQSKTEGRWSLEPVLHYNPKTMSSLSKPTRTSTNVLESSNSTSQPQKVNDTSTIGDIHPHSSPNDTTPPTTSND